MEKQGDLEGGMVECHKPQKEHSQTNFTRAWWSNDLEVALKSLENGKHEHLFRKDFLKRNEYPVSVKISKDV